MIGSPLDAIRFWNLAAVLIALSCAWLVPASWLRSVDPLVQVFCALARRRTLAICIVGVIAFCGDAVVSLRKPPVPTSFDEFSYLLAADTFAQGRITNPTPSLPQFFETPEVLLRPTYQSKYPPAQGLFLALGQWLAGSPILGVWLSSALACAAICWMLQAWTTESWALYGGLLAALRLAFFGPWAQSYWGGMVAALGGALLYGALRRIVDDRPRRWVNSLLVAFGIAILANTRPFEGMLASIPALIMLLIWMLRTVRHQHWRRLFPVITPALLVLLLAAAAMLHYNRRITGDRWTLPYAAYEKMYDPVPSFAFQQLRPMPRLDSFVMQASAEDTLWTWRRQHGSGRLSFLAGKLLQFWQFLFGAAFSAALVLLVWSRDYRLIIRCTQTGLFLLIQFLAVLRALFFPTAPFRLVVALLMALIIQIALLLAVFEQRWERLAVITIMLVGIGIASETWRFHSHYVGPIVGLAFALVVRSLQRADAKVFALLLPILVFGFALADSARSPGILDQWAEKRTSIQKQLQSQPGKQLVFVYYRANHDLYEEWVHNGADLARASVVWAHSRSAEENCSLIKLFPDRKLWSLDADRGALHPYSSDCASVPGPDELVPNQ